MAQQGDRKATEVVGDSDGVCSRASKTTLLYMHKAQPLTGSEVFPFTEQKLLPCLNDTPCNNTRSP